MGKMGSNRPLVLFPIKLKIYIYGADKALARALKQSSHSLRAATFMGKDLSIAEICLALTKNFWLDNFFITGRQTARVVDLCKQVTDSCICG